jgi:replicative DNA helicase
MSSPSKEHPRTHDYSEIKRCAQLLLDPDQVYEIRAIGKDKYRTVTSGYFNDPEQLAINAAKLSGNVAGVYFTANPVLPDLLARSANRVKERPRETTSDTDIVSRRWLLVDFDPRRPTGISSTDAEHTLAIAKTYDAVAWLTSLGWPKPMIGDSGNGCHALYRVDLPNDRAATDLMRDCLNALALLFDDESVSVDVGNFNAARIWKLYGTKASKGDDLPERPHRMSRILDAPDNLEVVPLTLLQDLAARVPKELPRDSSQSYRTPGQPVALEEWLAKHQVAIRHQGQWNGGQKWVLERCVWNPEHNDKSAYIVRLPSGAIAAGCKHNSCQGKGWKDIREAVEPGYKERQSGSPANRRYANSHPPEDSEQEESSPFVWEPPQPFDAVDVPLFPVTALPPDQAEFVSQEALAKQVPVDLPACLVLGALAASVGRKANVIVSPDWSEPLNEYFAVVLPSGERKSPEVRSVLKPLEDFEKELVEEQGPEVLWQQTEHDILEKKLQNAKASAAKLKGADGAAAEAEARQCADALANFTVPTMPRLLADDATSEAVSRLLALQKGRLAIVSTEGGIFDIIAGRYSDGTPNLDVYLKAYSGDTVRVDRASANRPPEFVPNAALTVILTVQPDVITDLSRKRGFRGRGFLARWSYSLPVSWVGYRNLDAPFVDPQVRRHWHSLLRKLLELPVPPPDNIPTISLSSEAHQIFRVFRAEVETAMRPGEELDDLQDWGNKLAGRVARYAGLLHMAQWANNILDILDIMYAPKPWDSEIAPETMQAAVQLGHYFRGHALAAYTLMGSDGKVAAAKKVWTAICRHRLKTFKASLLWTYVRRSFGKPEELYEILNTLVDLGYIRLLAMPDRGGPGKPPSPVYEANPLTYTPKTPNTESGDNYGWEEI